MKTGSLSEFICPPRINLTLANIWVLKEKHWYLPFCEKLIQCRNVIQESHVSLNRARETISINARKYSSSFRNSENRHFVFSCMVFVTIFNGRYFFYDSTSLAKTTLNSLSVITFSHKLSQYGLAIQNANENCLFSQKI